MEELLHAMGRPLTILQTCRLAKLLPRNDQSDVLAEMAGEVERLTELYRGIRDVLGAELASASSTGEVPASKLPLQKVVACLAADWQQKSRKHGVGLELQVQGGPKLQQTRATQALASLFAIALSSTEHGDRIRLWSCAEGRSEVLALEGGMKLTESSQPVTQGLRIAEALLKAEGAITTYGPPPFVARIEFAPE